MAGTRGAMPAHCVGMAPSSERWTRTSMYGSNGSPDYGLDMLDGARAEHGSPHARVAAKIRVQDASKEYVVPRSDPQETPGAFFIELARSPYAAWRVVGSAELPALAPCNFRSQLDEEVADRKGTDARRFGHATYGDVRRRTPAHMNYSHQGVV